MALQTIFDYESDWVNYFESILRNEIREDIDNRNSIKANIVESNQTVQQFANRNNNIDLIPSREKFFHNLIVEINGEKHYFYLDNSNERFWVVHNVEKKSDISSFIQEITTNSYLQDSIYLTHHSLENFQKITNASSLGFTLNFNQLFSSNPDIGSVFKSEIEEFEDIGFTLQLWPKRKRSIQFFLDKLREINCPINYKSLNFVFEEENAKNGDHDSNGNSQQNIIIKNQYTTREVLIKEDLYYNGSSTINRGKDFRRHIKFLDAVRDDYSNKMDIIESYKIDWENMKGGLYKITFEKDINPHLFIDVINKGNFENLRGNPFKINALFMYKTDNSYVYNCIDSHTGGKFYLQVFNNKIILNLEKDSCGNILFRLFTNLQRYFSINLKLFLDNSEYKI